MAEFYPGDGWYGRTQLPGGGDPSGSTTPSPYYGITPRPPVPLALGGPRPRPLAQQLGGTWSSKTVNTHPFQGLESLLQSSILGRLMSQRGVEGSEVRGLDGGAVAWNHLEDPFGRLSTTTNTYRPAVAPPRKKFGGMADQLQNVFTKVLDENGYPKEAFPGPWQKTGLMSNGQPMQYKHGQTGENIANPYL